MTAPRFDVRVIDSREMADARRRELDLDRQPARRLGEEAVCSVEQGWYAAADGRRVPWSEAVEDAKRRTLSHAGAFQYIVFAVTGWSSDWASPRPVRCAFSS